MLVGDVPKKGNGRRVPGIGGVVPITIATYPRLEQNASCCGQNGRLPYFVDERAGLCRSGTP